MTLSIVARCSETGRLGVAVASCVLAVGARIPAARAGVGAVVVQGGGRLHWRQALLDLLDRGLGADEAVRMLASTAGAPASQLAAVGATGRPAAWTGPNCTPDAGHLGSHDEAGDAVSAQANTVVSPEVWAAMLEAHLHTDGPLEHRLVTALAAADRVGGDYRGRQSAAVLVVSGERGHVPTGAADDPTVDLRVDDAERPTDDLARLLEVHRAHRDVIRSGAAGDAAEALLAVRAAASIAAGDRVVAPLLAIRTALSGDADTAAALFEDAARVNPSTWAWARRRAEQAATEGEPHAAVLQELVRGRA